MRAHTHECRECHRELDCTGTLERNYDGWPEVICRSFDVWGMDVCTECNEKADESDVTPEATR
jgi:hypothetical protein